MPLLLAPHILKVINLTADATPEEFNTNLELCSEGLPYPLRSAACMQRYRHLAGSVCDTDVEMLPCRIPLSQWGFHRIHQNGICISEVVEVPEPAITAAPSDAEVLLADAWHNHAGLAVDGAVQGNCLIIGWKVPKKNVPPEVPSLIASLYHADSVVCHNAMAEWRSHVEIDLPPPQAPFWTGTGGLLRVFGLAVSESQVRWRFLNLYRVLEHAYLNTILETLTGSFFAQPSAAVDSAGEALKNELNQLVHLVEGKGLTADFDQIAAIVDQLRTANRMAAAMHSLYEKWPDRKARPPRHRIGAFFCYKLRCAVVHAGQSAPVYENYSDADSLLSAVIPSLESAVADLCQIRSRPPPVVIPVIDSA